MVKIFQFNPDREKNVPEKIAAGEEKRLLLSLEIILRFTVFMASENAKKLKQLNGSKESDNISTDTVRGYTGEELIGWLESTGESDWTAKPSFFQAILRELQDRIEIARKYGDRFKNLN